MKYIFLIAAVAAVATALNGATQPISGSYAGSFPPRRDFISDIATGDIAGGSFTIVGHKVLKESYGGRTVTGHGFVLAGVGDAYHTYVPKDKCPGRAPTSKTSASHGCYLATNAGFFDMNDGSCIGPVVSDGNIVHSSSMQGAVFGITSDGKFAAGYANQTLINSGKFKQLVQGRGWLIHNGQSYLSTSASIEGIPKAFINLIAPRLAIGWDAQGRLILVVVDGNESKKQGINLNDFVDLLGKFGCVEAINLDGGGSVTFVWNGHYCESNGHAVEACENTPTVYGPDNQSDVTERSVTSITCFKQN